MKFHPSTRGQAFIEHFIQFGSQFYTIQEALAATLSPEDSYWLTEVGLPSEGIPFLYFDTLLAELRGVSYEDGAVVIGTAFDVTSRDYVVIDPKGEVWIRCADNRQIMVNTSVEQLFGCIFAYSMWLGNHETLYMTGIKSSIDEEAVFDLYCRLRDVDKAMFDGMSLWPEVVQADHAVIVELDNMDLTA